MTSGGFTLFLLVPLVPGLHNLGVDVVLVMPESPFEAVRYVEDLVDEGSLLILIGEDVEPLSDDLYNVLRLSFHGVLPYPAETVDPCDGPSGLGAPTPNAVN